MSRLCTSAAYGRVTDCEILAARAHALPDSSMPVRDRWMTLSIRCREPGEYTHSLKGIGSGKDRRGGVVREFVLCENHSRLFEQIDVELLQEAWDTAYTAKPSRIP